MDKLRNDNYVSVILCRNCSSRYVEISEGNFEENNNSLIIHCRSCNATDVVKNFTLGRCKVDSKELLAVRDTAASKKKYEK